MAPNAVPVVIAGGIRCHSNPDHRGNLSYRIAGRGHDVVFLHALGTSLAMWDGLPLPNDSWRLIAPDLRGHGGSAPATDGDYSFEALAKDVASVLDREGVKRASVVGVSVGGEVAQTFASMYPDRVERLMLVSTACVTHAQRANLWAQRIAEASTDGMGAVAERAVRRWFTDPFQQSHPDVVTGWQRVVAATSRDGYIGIARTIQTMDLTPLLSKIECETVVLSGALDASTGPSTAAEISSRISGSTVRVIEDGGHLWNLEMPERFHQELVACLRLQGSH